MECMLKLEERSSERLNSIGSSHDNDAFLHGTERFYAKWFVDNSQASGSVRSPSTLRVTLLIIRGLAETHATACFMVRVEQICKLHVLYVGDLTGTG